MCTYITPHHTFPYIPLDFLSELLHDIIALLITRVCRNKHSKANELFRNAN